MKYLPLVAFSLFCLSLHAQGDCPPARYRTLLREADQAVQQGKYDLAIDKLQSAQTCQPDSEAVVNRKVVEVFQVVNRQKIIAETNLAKANRLIHHLNFQGEGAAWAYKNAKFAVINLNGDTLTDFVYDAPEQFHKGRAIAQIANSKVLLNTAGEELSERYDVLLKTETNCLLAMRGSRNMDFLADNGRKAFPINYDPNWILDTGLIRAGWYGKMGMADGKGHIIADTQYQEILPFAEGLAGMLKNGKWGYINRKGEEIVPAGYDYAPSFFNGKVLLSEGQKRTLITNKGERRQAISGESIFILDHDKYGLYRDKQWSIVESDGAPLVQETFQGLNRFTKDWVVVKKKDKWQLFSLSTKTFGKKYFDEVENPSEGLMWVKMGKTRCLIDTGENIFFTLPDSCEGFEFKNGRSVFRCGGKYGCIDISGKQVIPPQFDRLNSFNEFGVAAYLQNGFWGLVDSSGVVRFQPAFSSISQFVNGQAIAEYRDKYALIHYKRGGTPAQYDEIRFIGDSLIGLRTDQYWEFTTQKIPNKLVLIPIVQTGVQSITASVKSDAVPTRLTELFQTFTSPPTDGVISFDWKQKVGFMDMNGAEIAPPIYTAAGSFSEGMAKVNLNGFKNLTALIGGKWGFIDREHNVPIGFIYDDAGNFYNGFAKVNQGKYWSNNQLANIGKWGFINPSGKLVVPMQFDDAGDFSEGLARINQGAYGNTFGQVVGGKWGFIDTSGRLKIDYQFDAAEDFTEGLCLVQKAGKWGFIDHKGQTVVPFVYDKANSFSSGLAAVSENGKWGFIDTSGTKVIAPQFDAAYRFSGGEAIVQLNEKYGAIDRNGAAVLPPEYYFIGQATNGKRFVLKDRHMELYAPDKPSVDMHVTGFILPTYSPYFIAYNTEEKGGLVDLSGNIMLPFQYKIYPLSRSLFLLEQNGKYGLFEPEKGIFLPAEFSQIGQIGEQFDWIRVQQNGKWGWVDKKGKIMIPFQYDAAAPFQNGKALVRQEPFPDFFYINPKGEMLLIPIPK